MPMLRIAFVLSMLVMGPAPSAGAVRPAAEAPPPAEERVYLTLDQALKETFPAAARYDRDVRVITAASRESLEKKLGGGVADDSVLVHKAIDASGKLLGYGVVSEEIGKYHPITFLVGTTPDLRVERVSVLVYRESHGGDVRRQRFLSQYRGKTPDSPLRVNRDIVNISGATLSVQSLNFGVKKVLAILGTFYPPPASKP